MNNKRDWVFVIAILMLIEYIVFNWTFTFGADKNLTDHISFAGTIVSIILAVVAIVYSFIQAESQARSSSEIAQQIASLKDVATDIDISKKDFSLELDRIDGIANKLDTVNLGIVASHQKVDSVADAVAAVQKKLEQSSQSNLGFSQIKFGDEKEIAKVVLSRTTFEADIMACSLYKFYTLTGKEGFSFSDFVNKFFSNPILEVNSQKSSSGLIYAANQIITTLAGLNLLSYGDREYKLSPTLIGLLPTLVESAKGSGCDWVRESIRKIESIT